MATHRPPPECKRTTPPYPVLLPRLGWHAYWRAKLHFATLRNSVTNTNGYRYSYSNSNSHSNSYCYRDSYVYAGCHANCYSYTDGYAPTIAHTQI